MGATSAVAALPDFTAVGVNDTIDKVGVIIFIRRLQNKYLVATNAGMTVGQFAKIQVFG